MCIETNIVYDLLVSKVWLYNLKYPSLISTCRGGYHLYVLGSIWVLGYSARRIQNTRRSVPARTTPRCTAYSCSNYDVGSNTAARPTMEATGMLSCTATISLYFSRLLWAQTSDAEIRQMQTWSRAYTSAYWLDEAHRVLSARRGFGYLARGVNATRRASNRRLRNSLAKQGLRSGLGCRL